MDYKKLIDKLDKEHSLELNEYLYLIENYNEASDYAREKAVEARKKYYSNTVFIRGLIEITNYCKNDCYYCGIRKGNTSCTRYRLTKDDIMACARVGHKLGFRTFVLQGGEDYHFNDDVLCDIVYSLKKEFPRCAVTLSVGERSYESYKRLFDAGADRYLLRHETINGEHYGLLHPKEMLLSNRIECLENLKKIGFQVGCGIMVGSPYQTNETIAQDLKFIETFKPDMCGIGPFIPHKDTKFKDFPAGSADLTCFLLSIVRLIKPNILLPSTTALGSIEENGRERGILSGANVIMPNLSPESTRALYELYNNKLHTGCESAQGLRDLKKKIESIGYKIVVNRGDVK